MIKLSSQRGVCWDVLPLLFNCVHLPSRTRLLDWVDRDEKRPKCERILIFKNMFNNADFEVRYGDKIFHGKCARAVFIHDLRSSIIKRTSEALRASE